MIHPHNPGAACTEACSPIDYYPTAMGMMAQDFLQLCPSMRKLAVTSEAMVSRYYHYCAQGQRPPLPDARPTRAELICAINNITSAMVELSQYGGDYQGPHLKKANDADKTLNALLDRLEFAE